MWFSVPPEFYDRLRNYARGNGIPIIRLIRNCVNAIPWHDDKVISFIVTVPKSRLKDRAKLEASLDAAKAEILRQVVPQEGTCE
jgi:hypothetical protein